MWRLFTNLGDAAVTLPVALTCAIWIALIDARVACRWLLALTAGMCIVGVTKVLHAGWGLSVPDSRFTHDQRTHHAVHFSVDRGVHASIQVVASAGRSGNGHWA